MRTTAYGLRRAVMMVERSIRDVRREQPNEPIMFGPLNVHWIESLLIAAKGTLASLERLKKEDDRR